MLLQGLWRSGARALIIILLSSTAVLAKEDSKALRHVHAEFSVYINNKKSHGENHLLISQDKGHYHIEFSFEHSLLSVEQKADFYMQNCKVEPLSYRDITRPMLGRERMQTLTFDQQTSKAIYKDQDQEKVFVLDGKHYDPISLFFEARCELMQGNYAFSYPVIRKGKRRTQRFEVVGKQMVETGQGTFETLVIERQRSNKKRLTRFYVAPELDFLLVMIEHRESRLMSITARLNQMDYQLTKP